MNYIDTMEEQIRNDLRLIRRHEAFKNAYISGRKNNSIVISSTEITGPHNSDNYRPELCHHLASYSTEGIDIDFDSVYEATETSIEELFDTSKGLTGLKELTIKAPYPKDIDSFIRHMADLRQNLFDVAISGNLRAVFGSHAEKIIDCGDGDVCFDFLRTMTGGNTRFSDNKYPKLLVVSDYREFEKILLKIADFIESFKQK